MPTTRTNMQRPRNKGPLLHRIFIGTFCTTFCLLCYWLLGFIVDDLGSLRGPNYQSIEDSRLDQELVSQDADLTRQIETTEREIEAQKTRQTLLSDSTQNSQRTMNQILEFQRLSLQKDVTPSVEEQKALADSQQRFLATQKQYEQLNEQISTLNDTLRGLKDQHRETREQISRARIPIREEFNQQQRQHRWKIATLKLAVMIPLLLIGVTLFIKSRGSSYAPIVYGYGIAVALKTGAVMHEYFPARYFKYILILVVLMIVLRILFYLLGVLAHPNPNWLMKQYREAYELFQCPICSYPIRRGPLKYAYWTRRSIKRMPNPAIPGTDPEQAYTCPHCSTRLFEPCAACEAIRPSLLPTCQHCGDTRLPSVFRQTDGESGK